MSLLKKSLKLLILIMMIIEVSSAQDEDCNGGTYVRRLIMFIIANSERGHGSV